MSQPTSDGWQEQMELRLEGGGHLPGATEVVAIKHQISSCSASRRDNLAYVQGEMEIFVYYRLFGSEQVRGQGAKIPWYAEVPIPNNVRSSKLDAKVIDVKHEHSFDAAAERLSHTMHLIFDVWALDQPKSNLGYTNRRSYVRDDLPDLLLDQRDPFLNCRVNEPKSTKGQLPSSLARARSDAAAHMPDWAREAAEEMIRVQQPTVKRSRSARKPTEPSTDPELGSAQGSFTRAGQPYTGPEPDWPDAAQFEFLDEDNSSGVPPEDADEDTTVIPPLLADNKEDHPMVHMFEESVEPIETVRELDDTDTAAVDRAPSPVEPAGSLDPDQSVASVVADIEAATPDAPVEESADSTVDTPVAVEPVVEEPVVEEPVVEEPVVEEPVVEEPVVADPIAAPISPETQAESTPASDLHEIAPAEAGAEVEAEAGPEAEAEIPVADNIETEIAAPLAVNVSAEDEPTPVTPAAPKPADEVILVWKPFPKTKLN